MQLVNRYLALSAMTKGLSLTYPFMFMFMFMVMVGLVFNTSSALAQNKTIELESTFKGNQEQPKVLYIVPWQKIAPRGAFYQPLESLVDESFELLDRDEFKRAIKFKRQLNR